MFLTVSQLAYRAKLVIFLIFLEGDTSESFVLMGGLVLFGVTLLSTTSELRCGCAPSNVVVSACLLSYHPFLINGD